MKRDYRKCRSHLKQTGAGVHPDDPDPNLLSTYISLPWAVSFINGITLSIGQIQSEFPHYDELDQIWQGIPGFDSDLISSDPTVDHAQSLLSLVHSKPSKKTAPVVDTQDEDIDDEPHLDDGLGDAVGGYGDGEDFFGDDMQVDDGGSGSGRRVDEPCDDEDEPMAPDNNLNSFFAGVSESHSQVSIKLWAMGLTLNNPSRFLQPFRGLLSQSFWCYAWSG